MRTVEKFPLFGILLGCLAAGSVAQEVNVMGRIFVGGKAPSANSTVVWLTPVDQPDAEPAPPMHAVLRQKNKSFQPHLLVVTKGSAVEFPNDDPWFHNVFSYFDGKRFDLGLYEAGTTKTEHFDRVGVSYIFCNIHPEMSAVVVVLSSNHFAVPDKQGDYAIAGVPPGRYKLRVWSENIEPAALQALTRDIQISENTHTLGAIHVPAPPLITVAHKNKYGQDYEPPSPTSPAYAQQP